MFYQKMFKKERSYLIPGTVLSIAVLFGTLGGSVRASHAQASKGNNPQVESDVHKALDHKRFENVKASVQHDNVVLTGSVETFADKEDADRRVHHVKGTRGVENEIQVAGSSVEDATLRKKLSEKLTYDRVGYGTTAFNAITIGVQNGVVTLGGTVYGPEDKDSALSLVSHTAGVRDVIDNLEVAPLSPMDDQLRQQLARTIYGTPQLQKYFLDPAKPIRIVVVNGNVTLAGMVDSKMDRDIAGLKANGVPGVFKVNNELQVEGQHAEK